MNISLLVAILLSQLQITSPIGEATDLPAGFMLEGGYHRTLLEKQGASLRIWVGGFGGQILGWPESGINLDTLRFTVDGRILYTMGKRELSRAYIGFGVCYSKQDTLQDFCGFEPLILGVTLPMTSFALLEQSCAFPIPFADVLAKLILEAPDILERIYFSFEVGFRYKRSLKDTFSFKYFEPAIGFGISWQIF